MNENALFANIRIFCRNIIIAYVGVLFFPQLINVAISDEFYHSWEQIALFMLLIFLMFKLSLCLNFYSYFLGFLYSVCIIWGQYIMNDGIVPLSDWKMWGGIFIYSYLFAQILEALYQKFKIWRKKDNKEYHSINQNLIWAGIFVAWVPIWLALYPGAFAYDASYAYNQIESGAITSHHPVLHTLVLGNFVRLGNVFGGGYNHGIALYCLLQMLLVSFIFSRAVSFVSKNVWSSIGAFIWYAFFPVVAVTAGCTTKDVLFSAIALSECIYFYQILRKKR